MATPGSAWDAGTKLSSDPRTAMASRGSVGSGALLWWVGGHASACGMQCPRPQGTGVHMVASLDYGLVWLSRAAAVGVSQGARSPTKAPHGPSSHPSAMARAFLGSSHAFFILQC